MIDHFTLKVKNLGVSKAFYQAALIPLIITFNLIRGRSLVSQNREMWIQVVIFG